MVQDFLCAKRPQRNLRKIYKPTCYHPKDLNAIRCKFKTISEELMITGCQTFGMNIFCKHETRSRVPSDLAAIN